MMNVQATPIHSTAPILVNEAFADDVLRGAEAIADFLYGDATQRRKVYHLAGTSRLPIFRLGSVLCARRTVLLHWITDQEQRGYRAPRHAALISSPWSHRRSLAQTGERRVADGGDRSSPW